MEVPLAKRKVKEKVVPAQNGGAKVTVTAVSGLVFTCFKMG